jgi:hypothetical protein
MDAEQLTTNESILVEDRIQELRRVAAELGARPTGGASRIDPGRVRRYVGGRLIALGRRVAGASPPSARRALTPS